MVMTAETFEDIRPPIARILLPRRPEFRPRADKTAAGAPYYTKDGTPWSTAVSGCSTQHAICLLSVEGLEVRLEIVSPETLEVLDRVVLR